MLFSFQKPVLPPPNLDLYQPLVLFVRQSCNGNNALLVMKASSLLPSYPRVFCPLLSSSVLFPFFGKPSGFLRGSASYYCCRTGYKLLQERSPAILSRHGKTRASSVLRMAHRKRCYTLYLLFLLFSLLSRLHRNNANNPDTLFFRMNHFPHFSCDRFLIDCPWFFFSTCVFVKKISSNRGEALILMYQFRSQFCGLKTGK